MLPLFLSLFFLLCPSVFAGDSKPLPRTILALHSDEGKKDIFETSIHQFAEMPLNHLGLKVLYHNIQQGLPKDIPLEEIRGILTWFPEGTKIPDTKAYLKWAADLVEQGVHFVILGAPSFFKTARDETIPPDLINNLLEKLGLHYTGEWEGKTFSSTFVHNKPYFFRFAKSFPPIKPSYPMITPVGKETTYLLTAVGSNGASSILASLNNKGGYVASGYTAFNNYIGDELKRFWFINPFLFFRKAFATDSLPKPDTTTLAGKRIFYNQIDGDGWNNVTEIERYKGKGILSSEVILKEVLIPHPEIPTTAGPIGADIDLDWVGTEKSIEIGRKIFSLAHIEAACHTYSHPLDWEFFIDYTPEKEVPFLSLYPYGSWKPTPTELNLAPAKKEIREGYVVPRSYANHRFQINQEIDGALSKANSLCPEGKKAQMILWSGNCRPFEEALRLAREAGIMNLNGGDNRFDQRFPSYAFVRPLGRQVGKERQIYSSNSNEITYTDLWTDRYYGFRELPETYANTESPIRIKPINLYYHFFTGEKEASLRALFEVINYIKKQNPHPIHASSYAKIANSFYDVKIFQEGEDRFRFEDLGNLHTIRFDQASLKGVNYLASHGVIGEMHLQGSLYVYLDKEIETPIIVLKKASNERSFFLSESNWSIWNLVRAETSFSFLTEGFGDGEMVWSVPDVGEYLIQVDGVDHAKTGSDEKLLKFLIPKKKYAPSHITIKKV